MHGSFKTGIQLDKVPLYSWIALGLMTAAYTFSWIDRYLLVILVDPIEKDLGLTDTQMGLLTGFAFSLLYSLAGFGFGRWADKGSRRSILAIAVGVWSFMTLAAGFAWNYASLLFSRASVAVFQSGCSPASHSMISDYFPPRRRSMAFSIYVLGISFGIWLGLALGGMISDHYGWRMAFIVLGVPGVLLGIAIRYFLKEPERGAYNARDNGEKKYPLKAALKVFWARRSFLAAILGLALLCFNDSAVQVWAPVWLMRVRDSSAGEIGNVIGAIQGIAGILGTLIAGYLADRFGAKDPRWYVWILIISAIISVPAQIMYLTISQSGSAVAIYGWLSVTVLCSSTYTAPMFALAQLLMPSRLKALGAATLLFVLNMIGTGCGPSMAGLMSDLLNPAYGQSALKYALYLTMLALIPGFLVLIYAIRRLPRDLKQADAES